MDARIELFHARAHPTSGLRFDVFEFDRTLRRALRFFVSRE